jgi:hypothetical protein
VVLDVVGSNPTSRPSILHFDHSGTGHLGIGIDTALPAPRSAIQIVSPAGSTAVGRHIGIECARRGKKFDLEMSGKSPL